MVKYQTQSNKIKIVEVVKETANSAWVKEKDWRGKEQEPRMRRKMSDYDCFFETWEEAKKFLVQNAESRVLTIRRQLEHANGELGNLKGMKQE